MKKVVFGTVWLCMMGLSPIIAQDTLHTHEGKCDHHHHRHHNSEGHLDRLKKELDLNDTQVAQVKAAFAAHHQKMKGGKDLADAEKKSLRQTSKNELETKLKSILSAEQYTKYEAKMQERKKQHRKRQHCKRK